MTILRIIGLAFGLLGIVLIGFLAVGMLLPSEWEAERAAFIDAPLDRVFPHLDAAEEWSRWTPSPESGEELFGPARGEGSGRRWDDPGYGRGEFVITHVTSPAAAPASSPAEVGYTVEVEGGSIRIQGRLRLEAVEGGTNVNWREEGDFGWNPLLGYLAGRMNEMQGAQMAASLEALRALVTTSEEPGTPEEPPTPGEPATPNPARPDPDRSPDGG